MRCVLTTWDYMDRLCRKVAEQIIDDGFEPEIIVALARGGWFAGRVLCDLLGLDDLTSLKVEHHIGDGREVKIRYPITEESVRGKRVLIADDIANTGESLRKAKEHVTEKGATEVRTATLLLLSTSKVTPDYFGEYVEEWAWVIFPWNFIEDMIELIESVMDRERELSEWDIKWSLYERYRIDPIHFEVAHPGRFDELMREMKRRGIVKEIVKNGRKYWKLI